MFRVTFRIETIGIMLLCVASRALRINGRMLHKSIARVVAEKEAHTHTQKKLYQLLLIITKFVFYGERSLSTKLMSLQIQLEFSNAN